jgi:predicted esterase
MMKKAWLLFFCTFYWLNAQAEVIKVPFPGTDTPTVYWEKPDSKGVLIFMPGGSGSFNLTKKNNPQPFWMLRSLFQSTKPNGGFDLVFMDSDLTLDGNFGEAWFRLAPRRSTNHIDRMKSTIEFYKNKTQKPVYLLGHSNGAVSIAEFLNQSPDNQKMVAGLIFSGSRNETDVKQSLDIPVLVMHHQNDPNRWTRFPDAEKLFERVKKSNKSITVLSIVQGGQDEGGDPSHTGRHMYAGAVEEAAALIDNFLSALK